MPPHVTRCINNFMKKLSTRSVALCIVATFALHHVHAQHRDDRYIISYGIVGVGTNDELQYGIGVGKGFHLWQGFSLEGLLEFDKFLYRQFQGHTSIISSEPSYSAACSAMLKIAAPWKISPYLTGGGGIAYVKRGDSLHTILCRRYTHPMRDGVGVRFIHWQ